MNKISKLTAVCFVAIAAIAVGCATDGGSRAEEKERTASAGTTGMSGAQHELDKYAGRSSEKSAVITFTKGTSELTNAGREKLRHIVSTMGVDNVSRVEIASWSDKNFPMTGADLPKADKNLADDRADKINDFLKDQTDLSTLRIRKYSMAETSNWLARLLRTDEAELRSVFAKEGETPMMRDDFNTIKTEGGPSRAVVVFVRK